MSDDEGKDDNKVTAHTYGALDTSQVTNECWLVRIPPSLAHVWNKAPEGTVLGDLVFTKGGPPTAKHRGAKPVKPTVQIRVAPEMLQEEDEIDPQDESPVVNQQQLTIPLNYSMAAMTKKCPRLHPFSRHPQNGSVKLWGTVTRTANLQVEQDRNYRQLLKDRLIQTSVNSSRFVKPVDAPQSVVAKQQRRVGAVPSLKANGEEEPESATFSNAVYQFGKRKLEAQQANESAHNSMLAGAGPNKRMRQFSPDQPMRSVIFELFEQQKYWTVKDLKGAAAAGGAVSTKKSETEIRDVLREIGLYHRSGDHKTMWELKKEFQQQS
ncbi:Transcription initiation factor IIF, beta subunit [Seminavis robusta]|uniref:Transcription initiation factor IIF, beta subunit n=1 Tax=Seminavis robusta TaxID=568900 RepID=A0A9N8H9I7_9STRA|nr:Transcription initiation factor IIF, beta subunit [Seminavis robusta]|eukprot:Sro256_g100630.1 Transcription initiation factor IIF, beta subunit (323) ;mRNA; f:35197-36290